MTRKLRLGYHKYFEDQNKDAQTPSAKRDQSPIIVQKRRPMAVLKEESRDAQDKHLQNTILNDEWEDSYSKDGILDSLIEEDRQLHEAEQAALLNVQSTEKIDNEKIMEALSQVELGLREDELDGFNEIVESLDRLMQQYKKRAVGDLVDHKEIVRGFDIQRKAKRKQLEHEYFDYLNLQLKPLIEPVLINLNVQTPTQPNEILLNRTKSLDKIST